MPFAMVLHHSPNKAAGAAIRKKKGAESQIRESEARVRVVELQGREYVDRLSAMRSVQSALLTV
jgi:hypothetical protein